MRKEKKALVWDVIVMLLSAVIMAAGMVIFTIPNNIAPGGVSGLATAVAVLLPIPIGLLSMLINIPLLLAAWRTFGWRKLLLTVIAAACFSVFVDVFTPILPVYTENRLLASVYGGAALGLGVGILMTRNMTTGGTDLLVMLLRKPFPHIPAGTLLTIVDAGVVLIAVILFRDIEVALYSAVTIFIQGKLIDAIMQGLDNAKVIMLITDKASEIKEILVGEKGLGLTEFTVRGGYTRNEKDLLMMVLHRGQMAETLRIAKRIDPAAFIIIQNAAEVHGEGFKEELAG
ncbi:MAG: YitT family protein [Clostridia bacterium]|nr:YitT family protein [Clostridia bacterium]